MVGLAGEYQRVIQGNKETSVKDEFDDPYAWIKYIGRPEKTPKRLLGGLFRPEAPCKLQLGQIKKKKEKKKKKGKAEEIPQALE